jgi:hypothetical protein
MHAFDFMSQILVAGRAENLLDFGRKIAFLLGAIFKADGACYFDLIAELDLCPLCAASFVVRLCWA